MDKPEIDMPEGPAPTELVTEDLTVGDGAEAVAGGNMTVHYVGVDYETGQQFVADADLIAIPAIQTTATATTWRYG